MTPHPERPRRPPGVCIPWEEKLRELPRRPDNPDLVRRQWEAIDRLAYLYIWHCLVSF